MTEGADPLVRMWLERRDGRATVPVLVRAHDDGRYEVHGADGGPPPGLAVGAHVRLLRAVHEDAQYATPVVVEPPSPGAPLWLRGEGERTRLQQRDHVRVATSPLEVALRTEPVEPSARREVLGVLLDVSAGGARVHHDPPPLPRGVPVRVRFDLPADQGPGVAVDVRADVRRVVDGGPPARRTPSA